jgi:DNA (cytosine-5)-methyltransferase 1
VNEKTHLDLFSGIGGFALAAKLNGYRTLGFCDNEPYAQAVLKKHWPDVPCHKDIREVRGELYAGVTLLTGGFPCQPFSVAGKQRGKDDNRYLWPEMLRVIQEARPTWIIGENVAGIVNMALDRIHTDLETQDYEVESFIIPACAVNAPHKRDRVWIVANSKRKRLEGHTWNDDSRRERERERERESDWINFQESCSGFMANTNFERTQIQTARQQSTIQMFRSDGKDWAFVEDPNGKRRRIKSSICGVAYGIPRRVDRIKGLGNAIVPQVAAEIIRCINKIMEDNK